MYQAQVHRESKPHAVVGERLMPFLTAVLRAPLADATEISCLSALAERSTFRNLQKLERDGLVAKVTRGTRTIQPSARFYPTRRGIGAAASSLGMTLGQIVRLFPVSREWLKVLSERVDMATTMYRVAATIASALDTSDPVNALLCRNGPLQAVITMPDGRTIGLVRQGMTTPNGSFNQRLKALNRVPFHQFPSLMICLTANHVDANRARERAHRHTLSRNFFTFTESRALLNGHDETPLAANGPRQGDPPLPEPCSTLEYLARVHLKNRRIPALELPGRDRAHIPDADEIVGHHLGMTLTPAAIRAFDVTALWQGITRTELQNQLGVGTSQITKSMKSLSNKEGLVHDIGSRGASRYVLTYEGIEYWAARDQIDPLGEESRWGNEAGETIAEWEGTSLRTLFGRERRHTESLYWLVSELARELHDAPADAFLWALPARRGRIQFNWNRREAIFPDATVATERQGNTYVPYLMEFERGATGPKSAPARLERYQRLWKTHQLRADLGFKPWILFVFPSPQRERSFSDAANESWSKTKSKPPIVTSNIPLVREKGVLGGVDKETGVHAVGWHYLWSHDWDTRWVLPYRPSE